MKKTFLILAIGAFSFINAQEAKPAPNANGAPQQNPPSPEMMATRQSTHLQKMLTLTDDQKQKVYQAVFARATAMQKIRSKFGPDADRKAVHAEVKPVKEQFVQTMNTILAPEQKAKWDAHRLKMKDARAKNKAAKGAPAATDGNGDSKKLMNDDDGIQD